MSARKVWVTKYALTDGIRKCSFAGHYDRDKRYVRASGCWQLLRMGRDCFDTEAEANARAVELAHAKLKSLDKAKARVESMLEQFHAKAGAK